MCNATMGSALIPLQKQIIIIYIKENENAIFVCFIHSVSLKLPLVSHNFFWMIKTTSSELESAVATASQCNAVRYFFTKSIIGCLSRMIIKPVGLSIRSISINRSSGLQSFFATSDKTVHAWSKS